MGILDLKKSWKVQPSWLLVVATMAALVVLAYGEDSADKEETYMVVLDSKPLVTYQGDIPGLRGTAKYFSTSWKKHHKRFERFNIPTFPTFKYVLMDSYHSGFADLWDLH